MTAEQVDAIIQAADHMSGLIGATGRKTNMLESPGATVTHLPQSLLNFPTEVATLDPQDDAVDAYDDEEEKRGPGHKRRWGATDRRQLKELKSQGLSDRQIGLSTTVPSSLNNLTTV